MLIIVYSLLSSCLLVLEPPQPTKAEKASLQAELHRMVQDDQDARLKMIAWMKEPQPKDGAKDQKLEDAAVIKRVQELDRKHTARLKEIVDKYGWPGRSLVGKDGAHDAWLLIQHADHDRTFQKRCLPLIEAAAQKEEASKQDWAYLADRVLVGEGKKQRFGTQFMQQNGEYVPQPIEDEANVDKRRADVGLPPLAEYKKMIDEMYKAKGKDK
jgi:hypothetical protein